MPVEARLPRAGRVGYFPSHYGHVIGNWTHPHQNPSKKNQTFPPPGWVAQEYLAVGCCHLIRLRRAQAAPEAAPARQNQPKTLLLYHVSAGIYGGFLRSVPSIIMIKNIGTYYGWIWRDCVLWMDETGHLRWEDHGNKGLPRAPAALQSFQQQMRGRPGGDLDQLVLLPN